MTRTERIVVGFGILAALATAAYATETITYTYDTRGRLIRVQHSGTVNNNVVTNYTIDNAENRTLKNTS